MINFVIWEIERRRRTYIHTKKAKTLVLQKFPPTSDQFVLRREDWERRGEGRRKGKRKTGKQNCIRPFFLPRSREGRKSQSDIRKKK